MIERNKKRRENTEPVRKKTVISTVHIRGMSNIYSEHIENAEILEVKNKFIRKRNNSK